MELTDERVVPEKMKLTNGLLLEHLARYHFTIPYLYGIVLDFACGSGYGTQIMAKIAKKKVTEVVGIDISEEVIKYAKKTYYHPKSTFVVGDVIDQKLPNILGKFDCIVSYETLEHVEGEDLFLQNIYEMLNPGGTLILSTPFGNGRGMPTSEPFHVHQLTRDEFFALFPTYSEVEFFYQKGVLVVPKNDSPNYPIGIAVCKK